MIILPSQGLLRTRLSYDPRSGEFRWRYYAAARPEWNTKYSDSLAGYLAGGYRFIRFDGFKYKASRLAWKFMTGDEPVGEVDHKNRRRSDDRWENLRDSTRTENGRNRDAYGHNHLKGVSLNSAGTRYRARICVNRHEVCLGTFNSEADAATAYDAAARLHFGEFACLNFPDGEAAQEQLRAQVLGRCA